VAKKKGGQDLRGRATLALVGGGVKDKSRTGDLMFCVAIRVDVPAELRERQTPG
jgi:hypothetical protein